MGRPKGSGVRDPIERFWEKVDTSGDCWLWTGSLDGRGYGHFWDGQKYVGAHRFSYLQLIGDISSGHQLDHRHTCAKRCVNPEHLRPVTNKQNQENHSGAQANSRSGVRGVSWHKRANRWVGHVQHRGRGVYVGLFDNLGDAEAAVVAKRNELFTHNDVDRYVSS